MGSTNIYLDIDLDIDRKGMEWTGLGGRIVGGFKEVVDELN